MASQKAMNSASIFLFLIAVGFFALVGVSMRKQIEGVFYLHGVTRYFEIGQGRVIVMEALIAQAGAGFDYRVVKTDPASPFTDDPKTETPVSVGEFLRSAFSVPTFGKGSFMAIPFWLFAFIFSAPFLWQIFWPIFRKERQEQNTKQFD